MKLLIDTQSFIWFVENDKQLPLKIKNELEDHNNTIIISIASLWEMAIKMSLGKLNLSCDIEKMIDKLYQNGFEILPILPEHINELPRRKRTEYQETSRTKQVRRKRRGIKPKND
jgi:PIN domain nuclease of toxin-antitoxin system